MAVLCSALLPVFSVLLSILYMALLYEHGTVLFLLVVASLQEFEEYVLQCMLLVEQ
jgi:hypothetical protein